MTVPPTFLIGRSFNRSIRGGLTLRSIGTSFPPILAVPLGYVREPLLMAVTTSDSTRLLASNALRSRSTETTLCFPPYGYGMLTPGTLISPTRIWFKAMSKTCCSESLALLIPNCRMETVDALYWMISGGVAPGGSCLKMVWETAVNWATAVEGFVPCLNKTLRPPQRSKHVPSTTLFLSEV